MNCKLNDFSQPKVAALSWLVNPCDETKGFLVDVKQFVTKLGHKTLKSGKLKEENDQDQDEDEDRELMISLDAKNYTVESYEAKPP